MTSQMSQSQMTGMQGPYGSNMPGGFQGSVAGSMIQPGMGMGMGMGQPQSVVVRFLYLLVLCA